MSLLTLRESIRATIETHPQMGNLKQVSTHGGRFDLAELQRWATQTPCIRVGALAVPRVDIEAMQVIANVQWGAFIVTRDVPEVPRDSSALSLLQALLNVVTPYQRWNDQNAYAPTDIVGTNIYNASLDKTGMASWALTWSQRYDITNFDPAELDDFLRYRSTAVVSETAQVLDQVDLPAPV